MMIYFINVPHCSVLHRIGVSNAEPVCTCLQRTQWKAPAHHERPHTSSSNLKATMLLWAESRGAFSLLAAPRRAPCGVALRPVGPVR